MAISQTSVKMRSGRKRSSAGNALVEFTILMPLLMVTMTGMVAFGFSLHNEIVLSNAVNLGAQALAFSRGQTTDPCATAYAAITAAAPSLTSGISVSYVINGTSYSATTTCAAGAAEMTQGTSVQVTATYPCALGVYGQSYSCTLKSQTTEIIQ